MMWRVMQNGEKEKRSIDTCKMQYRVRPSLSCFVKHRRRRTAMPEKRLPFLAECGYAVLNRVKGADLKHPVLIDQVDFSLGLIDPNIVPSCSGKVRTQTPPLESNWGVGKARTVYMPNVTPCKIAHILKKDTCQSNRKHSITKSNLITWL